MWTPSQRKYAQSSKGKLARKKYQESPKGIEAHKRYMLKRKAKLAEAKKAKTIATVEPMKNKVEGSKIKAGAVMGKKSS